MAILNKIIFSSLLLLLTLTPLAYGTVETWSVTLWELWIFLTTLLWGAQAAIEGRLRIERNSLILLLTGLLLITLLQLAPFPLASVDQAATRQAAIKLLAFLLFLLLFTAFVNSVERRRLVINTLIGVTFVIAIIGLGQSYAGKTLWQRGSFGPFVNRNHFAGFLEMGMGLAAGLLLGRGVQGDRIAIYLTILITELAALLVSASRGGTIAFIASALFLFLIARREKEPENAGRFSGWLRPVMAMALLSGMLIGAGWLAGTEELLDRFSAISVEQGNEV
ncbi:MAG: O-antigen ligase family protein, partial [Blastocatellia bacterium]